MNCHHTLWGYRSNDANGEIFLDWITNNDFELVYDAKDRKSFYSKAHLTETNPDLCVISKTLSIHNKTKRLVLTDFPHSPHRPIIINSGLNIHLVRSIQKPRWKEVSESKMDEFC